MDFFFFYFNFSFIGLRQNSVFDGWIRSQILESKFISSDNRVIGKSHVGIQVKKEGSLSGLVNLNFACAFPCQKH